MADKIKDDWQKLGPDGAGGLKEIPNTTGKKQYSERPKEHRVDPKSWGERAAKAYKGAVGQALGMKGY
jgi:hypothetical protein